MELIHYADGSVLTGSRIATALVDYAQALAANGASAAVEIPTRERDGSRGHARFLLGPASQIVAVSVPSDFDEVEDTDLVDRLESQTERERGVEVTAGDQGSDRIAPTDLDWEE